MFTVLSPLQKLRCLILSCYIFGPTLWMRDPGLTDEKRLTPGHRAREGGSLHTHCPTSPHRTRTTQILSRVSGWRGYREALQTDG